MLALGNSGVSFGWKLNKLPKKEYMIRILYKLNPNSELWSNQTN
jgi:hypothetical protein